MENLTGDLLRIALILFLVVLNGFFVATEFALVSIRRSRVDEMLARGVRRAKSVDRAVHNLDRYIAGTQVGITIASLALGWVGEPVVAHMLEPIFRLFPLEHNETLLHTISTIIAFFIITFLHVVLGELVPKSLALQRPEAVSLAVAAPMGVALFLFQPLVTVLNGTGNWLLKVIGMEPPAEHHAVHSVEELGILVQRSHEAGVLDDLERQMLQRTFQFSERVARDIMIPRIDMEMLNIEQPVEELLDRMGKSIRSRLPVYETTPDNILGIIHVNDVFKRIRKPEPMTDLRELIRPALIVPEGIHLDALLRQFREHRTHIAIVLDEYGATAGLITLEDLIEEVFGEIQDTLEAQQPSIVQLPDGRITVRGDVRLHEINAALNWELEDEEVDTIAGYVMKQLGRVAKLQDVVDTPFGVLQVTNMARLRITQVSIRPHPESDEGEEESS